METLCKIRDLQRAVNSFEGDFEERYGISLNEAMALCTLSKVERMCPGEVGERKGVPLSNMTKVLGAGEQRGLVGRELCCRDRRQTYYALTPRGRELLGTMNCHAIDIPEALRTWLGMQ